MYNKTLVIQLLTNNEMLCQLCTKQLFTVQLQQQNRPTTRCL